jgi:topoisomerase (DNA) II binding protein 1
VTRLGGTVCPGHGWDAAATHAVFGERGGRSLKFLAAAASGVPILDKSYLDASRRENALLPSAAFRAHLWRGGRGADMGLLTADASERWNAAAGRKAFEGLSVALAPFASKNREERDMLTVVLRCGGASVSSISAKGELVPANASPDVAVIDPSNKGALVGRAAGVVDAVAGGACVAP